MSEYLFEHYFDEPMLSRQRLVWALATRRQLERWELYIARDMALALRDRGHLDGVDHWTAESEHHLLLVAARNMLGALEIPPASAVEIDKTTRAEIIEGRDLLEHWRENMPIFNARPRPKNPARRTGRAFAKRNPREGPFEPVAWSSLHGASVMPNVTASALHEIIDAVEAEAIAASPDLARFVPPRAPSPWRRERGQWWPAVDL